MGLKKSRAAGLNLYKFSRLWNMSQLHTLSCRSQSHYSTLKAKGYKEQRPHLGAVRTAIGHLACQTAECKTASSVRRDWFLTFMKFQWQASEPLTCFTSDCWSFKTQLHDKNHLNTSGRWSLRNLDRGGQGCCILIIRILFDHSEGGVARDNPFPTAWFRLEARTSHFGEIRFEAFRLWALGKIYVWIYVNVLQRFSLKISIRWELIDFRRFAFSLFPAMLVTTSTACNRPGTSFSVLLAVSVISAPFNELWSLYSLSLSTRIILIF